MKMMSSVKEMLVYIFIFCCLISVFQVVMFRNNDFKKWSIRRNEDKLSWNLTWQKFVNNSKTWDTSEEAILNRTRDCTYYYDIVPALFDNTDIIEFEGELMKDFGTSIAFNIMVHSQPGIFEFFLALYFRPDNHYVIHLDKKASSKTRTTFSSIIYCYSAKVSSGSIVLLPKEESVSINWGTSSILKANLDGYRMLLRINQISQNNWSHVITNAGSELPISTYTSFRLKIKHHLNVTESSAESFPIPSGNFFRVSKEMKRSCLKNLCKSQPWIFQLPNPLAPGTNYTFQIFKGTHINTVLSANDVSYIANSSISKAYYFWIKNMEVSAEEHHAATLLRLKSTSDNNISQDLIGTKEDYYRQLCPKYVNWADQKYKCKGKWINTVCNFGVGDLDRVQASPCLFANKFSLNVDTNAILRHFIHVVDLSLKETLNQT